MEFVCVCRLSLISWLPLDIPDEGDVWDQLVFLVIWYLLRRVGTSVRRPFNSVIEVLLVLCLMEMNLKVSLRAHRRLEGTGSLQVR